MLFARGRALIALALLGLLAAAPAQAQGARLELSEVRREGGRLRFEIVTPGGPLLTSDDFAVEVNGLPAEDLEATPQDESELVPGAVLLVDVSFSMSGEPIAEARRAVLKFIDTVDPRAKLALVTFSTNVRVVSGFTQDHDTLRDQVRRLDVEAETALYDGLGQAVALLRGKPPEQRNIVLLSDGADTASRSSGAQVVRAARRASARVFAVALESPEFSGGALRVFARATGGRFIKAAAAVNLTAIFEGLAETLVSAYEISVVDPDPAASSVELNVALRHLGGTLSGGDAFELDVPPPERPRRVLPSLPIPMPLLLLLVFGAAGGAGYLLVEFVQRRRTPGERVAWYSTPGLAEEDAEIIRAQVLDRAKALATELAQRAGYLERIESEIETAGLKWKPGELIIGSVALSIIGFGAGLILGSAVYGVVLGAVGLVGPFGFARYKASARRRAFYEQLPDVLLLISGALRAGYSLQQALEAAAQDSAPPAAEELQRTMAEVRLGGPLDDALDALAARLGIIDLHWTVLAIRIQREVGGNLAEIMEIISETIRERERLRRHLSALTAEGKLSAWVLGLLPFVLAGVLYIQSRDYLALLWTTRTGLFMMAGAGVMMAIGVVWMRKIINIEV